MALRRLVILLGLTFTGLEVPPARFGRSAQTKKPDFRPACNKLKSF